MLQDGEQTAIGSELLDTLGRPMKDLRISVIDNCNLRCTYCMPLEKYGERYQFLPESELLSFDEIERLVSLFVGLGVTKIRLTGGEPLLRKGMYELISRIADVDGVEDIALTTNGLYLRRDAATLRAAGLNRITVSLDSLDPEVFGRMNGRGVKADGVLDGIEAALQAGFGPVKVNAVVQKGVNDHTVLDLAAHFRNRNCIVRFIEYMDVGTRNAWKLKQVVSSKQMMERIHERFPLKPMEKNYSGEVAARYAYEDGAGEIGFISSVSKPFCGACTRARLSADGRLYTCLFAGEGLDLRGAIRNGASEETLLDLVVGVWKGRDDRYSELRTSLTDWDKQQQKIEMYQIGG